MGNWRTVNIIGTCSPGDLPALQKACYAGKEYDNFHPLCFMDQPSLCGLNNWTGETINRIGNLSERDYSVEQVARTCEKLLETAPSLKLKIHCGDEHESRKCVATITVDKSVSVGPAEIESLPDISPAQMMGAMMFATLRR